MRPEPCSFDGPTSTGGSHLARKRAVPAGGGGQDRIQTDRSNGAALPAGGSGQEPIPLTKEERRSLTHGEFWIPEHERVVYQRALRSLNRAAVPYTISGLYAIYEYTGIYRQTKDLDLFFEPEAVVD